MKKCKAGGEKFLGKMMQMGGDIDMSDNFVNKMRKGGDTMKPSYKYGGAKKMQIGGSLQSRTTSYKKK